MSVLQGHPRLVKSVASLFSKLHGRDIQALSEVPPITSFLPYYDLVDNQELTFLPFFLQVIITNGADESLFCAISAFVNEGDEVG
jgi:hypothetical protein